MLQLQVWPGSVDSLLLELALVNDRLEALEAFQELVNVVHQLAGSGPRLVLGVPLQQDDDDGSDVVDTGWGLLQTLGFTQILLIQGVQRRLGLCDQGLGSGEIALAAGLLDGDLLGNDLALLGLNLSCVILDADLLLLYSDLSMDRKRIILGQDQDKAC